jgi:hypothetical protein
MKVLREPLLHFLLIGVGLFWLYSQVQPTVEDESKRVVVTTSQAEQFIAQFSLTWMRPPNETEMKGLIQSYIRDEIYYREAIALGLDRNDGLIRQRMRQKLEFILEDLTAVEPEDAALVLFLQENSEKFKKQAQISFEQVFLNLDKRENLAADAENMLQSLQKGAVAETLSDPTMLPYAYQLLTQNEIAQQLGRKFAQKLQTVTASDWIGPIYSGIGGHLVKVTQVIPARLPDLEEVRAEVKREYMAQRSQKHKDSAYQKMLDDYEVVIEPMSLSNGDDSIAMATQVKDAS